MQAVLYVLGVLVPVGSRADVDSSRFASRLELVRERHVVSEQTIPGHLNPDHPGQDAPGVDPNSHLEEQDFWNEVTSTLTAYFASTQP